MSVFISFGFLVVSGSILINRGGGKFQVKGIAVCSEVSESHSIISDSLWPHGLYSPWNSPGQNTGVGSLSLFQGIFPGIEPRSPALQEESLPAETPGKPLIHFELIFVPDVREDLTSLFCTWMVGCPLPICSRPLSWLSSTSVSSSGFPSMLVSVSNFPYLLDCP